MGKLKKSLAVLLAVICLTAVSFTSVFAASSPIKGQTVKKSTATYTIENTKTKTVIYKKVKTNTKKTYNIPATITVSGKKYKVSTIGAKAFAKCNKAKTIKINSKILTKVNKKAFKSIKKSVRNKLVVKVTKKMSKANFKKLKKALVKAGLKAKNIKRLS